MSSAEQTTAVEVVSTEELKELREAQRRLSALEAAGVDNWQGYDYAMEILHGEGE